MAELKSCPFCGGEAWPIGVVYHWVRCTDCGAETQSFATEEEAAAAWNRRAGDELLERMVDDGK